MKVIREVNNKFFSQKLYMIFYYMTCISYICVCMYTHVRTHTHTHAHMWLLYSLLYVAYIWITHDKSSFNTPIYDCLTPELMPSTGFARSGTCDFWGAEQCGTSHPQNHDAYTVTAAVSEMPGLACGWCFQGENWSLLIEYYVWQKYDQKFMSLILYFSYYYCRIFLKFPSWLLCVQVLWYWKKSSSRSWWHAWFLGSRLIGRWPQIVSHYQAYT